MTKVFIYGSIKKEFYNHTKYGFDTKTKFLGEAIIKGAMMYDLGSYPCIVLSDNLEDKVYGEIYEYLDSECEESIKRMEIGAGYKEIEVEIDGEKVKTYVFETKPSNAKLIKEGVWMVSK